MRKPRTSEDTMKPLKDSNVPKDTFGEIRERKWGVVRDLWRGKPIYIDWRNENLWPNQLFKLKIGKEEAVVSRQELERLLRHV